MGLCEAAPSSAGGSSELLTPKKGYHERPCGNTDLRELGIKLKEGSMPSTPSAVLVCQPSKTTKGALAQPGV